MRCPNCSETEDKVIDSRTCKEGAAIRRRRECLKCGKRFTTYEEVLRTELYVIKNDGRREEFSPGNIRKGIELACWKRNVVEEDLDRLQQEAIRLIHENFDSEIETSQIGEMVMKVLKDFDDVAYIRFASVYRQFTDVEEFITELKEMNSKKKQIRKKSKRGTIS